MQSPPNNIPHSISDIIYWISYGLISVIIGILGTWLTIRINKKANKNKDLMDLHTSEAQTLKLEAETIKTKIESSESAYDIVLRALGKVEEVSLKLSDCNSKNRDLEAENKQLKDEKKQTDAKTNLVAAIAKDVIHKTEE